MNTSIFLTAQNQGSQRGVFASQRSYDIILQILLFIFQFHDSLFISLFSQKGSPGKFSMNVRHNDDDRPDSAGPAATTIERGGGHDAAHD